MGEKKELEQIFEEYIKSYGHIPDWVKLWAEISPETLIGYNKIRSVALIDGILPKKIKELILVAINAYRRYEYGLRLHTEAAMKAGATKEEVFEAALIGFVAAGIPCIIEISKVLRESGSINR